VNAAIVSAISRVFGAAVIALLI